MILTEFLQELLKFTNKPFKPDIYLQACSV